MKNVFNSLLIILALGCTPLKNAGVSPAQVLCESPEQLLDTVRGVLFNDPEAVDTVLALAEDGKEQVVCALLQIRSALGAGIEDADARTVKAHQRLEQVLDRLTY